jgi:hypothetical protein
MAQKLAHFFNLIFLYYAFRNRSAGLFMDQKRSGSCGNSKLDQYGDISRSRSIVYLHNPERVYLCGVFPGDIDAIVCSDDLNLNILGKNLRRIELDLLAHSGMQRISIVRLSRLSWIWRYAVAFGANQRASS